MKVKYYNAKTNQIAYRDMTAEEIEAMNQHQTETPDPTSTIEDRLAKVEEDSSIIRAILLGEGE